MLRYPSPIEQNLDKLRDKMWQEAGRDPKKWFALIHNKNKQALQELQESGYIARDEGKTQYGK